MSSRQSVALGQQATLRASQSAPIRGQTDVVTRAEFGNPLLEPSAPAALREKLRRSRNDYDFLLTASAGAARLTPELLADAAHEARRLGLSIRRVLIGEGRVAASDYVTALARSIGVAYLADPAADGLRAGDNPDNLQQAWAQGLIGGQRTVTLDGVLMAPRALRHLTNRLLRRGLAVTLTTPDGLRGCLIASAGPAILRHAVSGLARLDPYASARAGSWLWQTLALTGVAGAVIGLVVIGGLSAQWLMAVLGTLPFLLTVALRMSALLMHRLPPPPLVLDDATSAARTLEDRALPVYTLLVPLFREAKVLPALVAALRDLDYPPAKLDIKLILESIDAETIAAAQTLALRPPFEIVIVPDRLPRTKPKALNYALTLARGDYVCVFDAEDRPEPGQLREAWRLFAAERDDLGCVQGRLAIDNENASWLSRQFSLEYLMLFDGLLPAFERLDAPMPLGGTSNHFPIRILRKLGGWDAYNVTEDADLGLRLARHGYRARMLSARTYEEAPETFGVWLPQRTRWLKGWMQTYIVHSRRPSRDIQALGPRRWLAMHAHFAGIILSCLLYPFSLAVVALQICRGEAFGGGTSWVEHLLLAAALFSMLAGHGIAILHAAASAIGRNRWGLLAQLPLMPVYWLLISLAAYRALYQLARKPFLWEKTKHGLSSRRSPKSRRAAAPTPVKRPGRRVLHS